VPHVQPFNEKYGLKSACIAETGLIKGIGKLAGMDIIEVEGATGGVDTNLTNITQSIIEHASSDYDFLLINIDGADEAGHDGNLQEKVEFIEKVDEVVGQLMDLPDTYFILTADHSTPISIMDHTGDPVPIIITGPEIRVDEVNKFNERAAASGGLCRIRGSDVMNILMDLMNKSEKFGA
jgi:2,3-bisphosphoglycerate-independent phosphoglycerate mutase